MATPLLTALYKELHLPKELKGTLSKCLGVEIPVEVKEKVDTNKITIQIENAFSGLIYLQETFNKNNTIKEMKEQVVKLLENKLNETLYEFRFYYSDTRVDITNEDDIKNIFDIKNINDVNYTIGTLYTGDDFPVLAVSYNTGNILMKLDY